MVAAALETRQSSATFHAEAAKAAIAVASSRGSTSCMRSWRRTSRREARNGDSPPASAVRRIHRRASIPMRTSATTDAPIATNSGARSSTKLDDWVASEVRIWTTAATESITSAPCASRDHVDVPRRRVADDSEAARGSRTTPSTATKAASRAVAVTTTAETTAWVVTTNGVGPSQIPASTRCPTTASAMPTGTVSSSTAAGSAIGEADHLARGEAPQLGQRDLLAAYLGGRRDQDVEQQQRQHDQGDDRRQGHAGEQLLLGPDLVEQGLVGGHVVRLEDRRTLVGDRGLPGRELELGVVHGRDVERVEVDGAVRARDGGGVEGDRRLVDQQRGRLGRGRGAERRRPQGPVAAGVAGVEPVGRGVVVDRVGADDRVGLRIVDDGLVVAAEAGVDDGDLVADLRVDRLQHRRVDQGLARGRGARPLDVRVLAHAVAPVGVDLVAVRARAVLPGAEQVRRRGEPVGVRGVRGDQVGDLAEHLVPLLLAEGDHLPLPASPRRPAPGSTSSRGGDWGAVSTLRPVSVTGRCSVRWSSRCSAEERAYSGVATATTIASTPRRNTPTLSQRRDRSPARKVLTSRRPARGRRGGRRTRPRSPRTPPASPAGSPGSTPPAGARRRPGR